MKKKVLIIYEKMGMGHLRMANILEESLEDKDIEIIKYAGSELIGDTSINTVVSLWNFFIKKNFIKTVDILLNFIFRIFIMPFVEVGNTQKFYNRLEEIKPDIIVSTADGFNKVLGTYAKENGIPFYIFITEISLFIDLVNPYATHICYFDETGEAIRNYNFNHTYFSYDLNKTTTMFEKAAYVLHYYKDFVVQGYKNSIFRNPNTSLEKLNSGKYRVLGPLAERKHFKQKNVDEIKEKYGFNNGYKTVVLASGSIGGRFLYEMVQLIFNEYKTNINLVVVCGKDEEMYNKLKNFQGISLNVNLMPFRYIENFDEVLAAADCIIGRPSAGIFIESILNRTPEITFRKATSNDKGTLTMIEKYKIGKVVDSNIEVIAALEEILLNKELYQRNLLKLTSKCCGTYEEKIELLRDIILNEKNHSYEFKGDFDRKISFNESLSN
jgi:UDP-N-acetylglucosamine:LPS N-acetylglucosamine transferase